MLKGLRILRELRLIFDTSNIIQIYDAMVQPNFDYHNAVWGDCGISLRKKLQKLRNRAAQIIVLYMRLHRLKFYNLLAGVTLRQDEGIKMYTDIQNNEWFCSKLYLATIFTGGSNTLL